MSDWTDKLNLRAVGEEDGFHGHDESLEDMAEAEKPVIVAEAEPAPEAQTTTDKSPGRKASATPRKTAARKTAARKR